jgi:hypothetical protein
MTQKEIVLQIKDLEKERQELHQAYHTDEKLKTLRQQILDRKEEIASLNKDKLDDIATSIIVLRSDLVAIRKKTKIEIPEQLEKWWKSYSSGVDFGYTGLKIRWISDDKRFVIITNPGGTSGTGTAMGSMGYYYAETDHWFADTTKGGYLSRENNVFGRVEGGRLTKARKQVMFDQMNEIR